MMGMVASRIPATTAALAPPTAATADATAPAMVNQPATASPRADAVLPAVHASSDDNVAGVRRPASRFRDPPPDRRKRAITIMTTPASARTAEAANIDTRQTIRRRLARRHPSRRG